MKMYFFFLRKGFSVYPWLSWNSLCRPGWPRTQKSACLSIFQSKNLSAAISRQGDKENIVRNKLVTEQILGNNTCYRETDSQERGQS